jgi:hypothetical protein
MATPGRMLACSTDRTQLASNCESSWYPGTKTALQYLTTYCQGNNLNQTECLQFSSDYPTLIQPAVTGPTGFCQDPKNKDSPICKTWCSSQPAECKQMYLNYCKAKNPNAPHALEDPLCTDTVCPLYGCSPEYRAYCANTTNKQKAVCGCFRDADFKADLAAVKQQFPLATILENCAYTPCTSSNVSLRLLAGGGNTLPPCPAQCLQSTNVAAQGSGQIIGNIKVDASCIQSTTPPPTTTTTTGTGDQTITVPTGILNTPTTPPTPPTPTPTPSTTTTSKLSKGAIIGIVVAIILLIIGVVVGTVFATRKPKVTPSSSTAAQRLVT